MYMYLSIAWYFFITFSGMTDVSQERTIVMDQFLNLTELVEWSSFGTAGLIVPKPGKVQQVK